MATATEAPVAAVLAAEERVDRLERAVAELGRLLARTHGGGALSTPAVAGIVADLAAVDSAAAEAEQVEAMRRHVAGYDEAVAGGR